VIANDGNLLPAPVVARNLEQAPAERFDIIIDFSQFAPGTQIILLNRAEQTDGRGPSGNLLARGMEALKFIVMPGTVRDDSRIPQTLRPLPDIAQPVSRVRSWRFDRSGGQWTVNGESYDRRIISAEIPEGTAERWSIRNGGGSWSHPVHIHYEEHRILSYNRRPPPMLEVSRKDVINLRPNAECEIYMRFRDYKGFYPMHCHNVVHEDHAMMIMFKIV
jgi:FtsP/CotA-like multicopper oxidase with cupredoxin domain